MIGQFEYKGTHSNTYGVYFKSIKRPLMPPIKPKIMAIYGTSGSYDFGDNEYDNVEIKIRIAYIPEDIIERKQRARDISSWLSSNNWEKLILGDEPDKYYLARVSGGVDLENLIASGEAEVTFICQPFAYMVTDTATDDTWEQADYPWITDITWIMSDSYTFSATGTKLFTFNNPGTKSINYQSPQGSKSLIKINGSWTTLNLSLNGNTLTYTQPGTGELIIDNLEMEATLNGTNALSAIDGDIEEFLEISPGDNIINISGTGINVEVTVDFAPMWI